MTTPNAIVLAPGSYLVELHVVPGVSTNADELRRALELSGFDSVIADEPGVVPMPPSVGEVLAMIGAVPMMPRATGPSPSVAQAHAAVESAIRRSPFGHGPPAPTMQDKIHDVAAQAKAPPSMREKIHQVSAQAKAKTTKMKPHGLFGEDGGSGGNGGDGSSGDTSTPAPTQGPDFVPDPQDDRYATDHNTGKHYYLDPNSGAVYGVNPDGSLAGVDQQTLSPLGGPPLPAPPPPDPQAAASTADASLLEQGDDVEKPFGEDPAFSMHVGAMPAGQHDVYRVIARTPAPITLRPGPGLAWAARKLTVDPYADVASVTKAFTLEPSADYELVVLARERKAKSRGDVWTLLEAMGFQPQTIALLQRNLHVPRRFGSSYARWIAVARWEGPLTITTAEEPLVFEQIEETT